MPEPLFHHRYVPGAAGAATVLALHGTGGTEEDLIPLAEQLAPGANVLAPRGRVLEGGMARFFRRLAIGVFDEADVRRAAGELADFVAQAGEQYGFASNRVFALGYSNGANVAAAVLLLHPKTLAGAALLRPVLPLTPEQDPDLEGRPVLIAAGTSDPYAPIPRVEALAELLGRAGAKVDLRWAQTGHELMPEDLRGLRDWLGLHLA